MYLSQPPSYLRLPDASSTLTWMQPSSVTYQMHNLTWFSPAWLYLRRDAKGNLSLAQASLQLVELLPEYQHWHQGCDLFGPTHWDWLWKATTTTWARSMSGTLASDALNRPRRNPNPDASSGYLRHWCPYPQMIPDHLPFPVSPGLNTPSWSLFGWLTPQSHPVSLTPISHKCSCSSQTISSTLDAPDLIVRPYCPDFPDSSGSMCSSTTTLTSTRVYARYYALNLDTHHTNHRWRCISCYNHAGIGLKTKQVDQNARRVAIAFVATKAAVPLCLSSLLRELCRVQRNLSWVNSQHSYDLTTPVNHPPWLRDLSGIAHSNDLSLW